MKTRIQAIADLVNGCDCFVDVGSDHSYLGIELLKNNKIKKLINIEINREPLENGINNLKKNNLLDRSLNILNNGFQNLDLDEKIDYCNISGMGSNNIIEIIESNQNQVGFYILQANTHVPKLRFYLLKHFFEIIDETLVFENDLFYEIILCKRSSVNQEFATKDLYISKFIAKKQRVLYNKYLKQKFNYLNKLNHSKININLIDEFNYIKDFLSEQND